MKTCIVTTTYLDPDDRFEKTVKFLDYYLNKTSYDIVVLDNASSTEKLQKLVDKYNVPWGRVKIISFPEHFGRPSHLDYKYLWRAVWHLQDFLKSFKYSKVIYMDNDFYILSSKMFEIVRDVEKGWTTFWCSQHGFPETGCHIITQTCDEYKRFVNLPMTEFIEKYNNQTMEQILPVTTILRDLKGDRYGEFDDLFKPKSTEGLDFWAQATLKDPIK